MKIGYKTCMSYKTHSVAKSINLHVKKKPAKKCNKILTWATSGFFSI